MARRIDLTGENITRRERQRNTYGNQTPLSSTAVERGETHWMDGSQVCIDGLLEVNGTTTITGTLKASGDVNLSGTTEITGPLDVTGTTTISGNTSITGELDVTGPATISGALDVTGPMATKGTLSVEGVTTLKNDLNVTAGGKIKAGDLMIEPALGGQINFKNGAIAASDTFGMGINHSTSLTLTSSVVKLNATAVNIATLPSKPAAQLTPIGIDAAGNIYRIA